MRRRRKVAAVAAAVLGTVVAVPAEAHAAAAPAPPATAPYIVTLDGVVGGLASTAAHLLESLGVGGQVVGALESIDGVVVDLPPVAADLLAALPGVTGVEPDRLVTIDATQTGAPANLDRIDQRLRPLNGTYDYGATGAGVKAYIIDTGVRATHRDFGGRVQPGINTVDGTPSTQDCNGHGTHVAGTVGGSTYGVAKAVSLVSVRVFGCDGSTPVSRIIEGIDWVLDNHRVGQPAVANLSVGGDPDRALDAAVRALVGDGITVAVAGGNDGTDACTESPSRVAEALTVGATDADDELAPYSNWGPCVDLLAPGERIVSDSATNDTGTATMSGTSMATPHVTGAAALYLQGHPTASPAAVTAAVLAKTTPRVIGGIPGTCNLLLQLLGGCFGYGTPNRFVYVGSGANLAPPPPKPCNPLLQLLGAC